jgi:hypothetical protein
MHLAPMIRPDHIKLKRAYEPPAPDDGTRILMDRLWPRRIELNETRYMNLIQMASASVKSSLIASLDGARLPHARIRDHALPAQGQHRSHGTPHRKAETRCFVRTGRSRPNRSCKGRAEQF